MKEINYIPGLEEHRAVTAAEFDRLYRDCIVHLSEINRGLLIFEELPDTMMDAHRLWERIRITVEAENLKDDPTFFYLQKPFVTDVGRFFPVGNKPLASGGLRERRKMDGWYTEAFWRRDYG